MRKYAIYIIPSLALFALAFIVSAGAEKVEAPILSNGDIINLDYDEDNYFLKIDYVDGGSDTFILNPNSLAPEVFKINGFEKESYLRFFSPALYESLGQPSQGVIILTRVDPSSLVSDPNNEIASNFPALKQPTTADLGFAMIHNYLEKHNAVGIGLPLCTAGAGDEILLGVATSSCYVECNGKAEVMARFLPAATRIIIMGSRSKNLENGYIFLWSELHATIEVFSNNEWYVADPTYGFAYVKDSKGRRLNAQELINALETQKVNDLTFGLVHDGIIHDVPGEVVVNANTALAGIYYTPDKSLSYRIVKSDSLTLPNKILGR